MGVTGRPGVLAVAVVAAASLAGCGGERTALVGAPVTDEVAEVTVVSDDSRATEGAVCIADIPDDRADCPGFRDGVGEVELDETRKGAVVVPPDIASGGYRLRINGTPPAGLDEVLDEQYQVFRVPVDVVKQPGPTTLTVEALRTAAHPRAVWRFVLSDPSGRPA